MTGRRARGVAARWCAAFAVIVMAWCAVPARAQWARNGDGDLQRWSPVEFVAALDRAGVALPRDRMLDAWQAYLTDWMAAADGLVPDAVAAMTGRDWNSMTETAEVTAKRVALERRAASERVRIERALVERLAADASPAVRARLDAVLRDRQLECAFGDAGLALGMPGGLETAPVEALVANALRADPAARAAADAALEPTRAARTSAANRVVAARAEGLDAHRRALEAAGMSALTSESFQDILERDCSNPVADAADPSQSPCTPGTEGDRMMGAISAGNATEYAPLSKPLAQLAVEQVKAIRLVMQAVPGPARERLARELARGVPDMGQRFPGRRLYMTLARADLPAGCEECLRSARDRWCAEFPGIVESMLADFARDEAGSGAKGFAPNEAWERRMARTERFAKACDDAVERLLAACPANCLLPASEGDGEPPVRYASRRLRGLAEFDALAEGEWRESVGDADDDAPAGADGPGDAADPFGLDHTPELLGRAPTTAAVTAALARCGVPADRMPAVEAVCAQGAEDRESTVGAAAERYNEALNSVWADAHEAALPAEMGAAARAAMPAMLDALRVHDDRFVDSVAAAAGLDADTARLVRLWHALGDSRSEMLTMGSFMDEGQGGLRLNPAEAVLATDLSPAGRVASSAVLARHAAALESRFRAWRRAAFDGDLGSRIAGAAMWGLHRNDAETTPDFAARRAARKDYRTTMLGISTGVGAARDAYDAEARATIDEALAAMTPADAAALRMTVTRRRFPELFLDEELVRASVADVLERLPDEDVGTRLSLARALDGWVAVAGAWRTGTLERCDLPRAVFAATSGDFRGPDAAALEASMRVGNRRGGSEMLFQLGIERLACAASIDALEASPKFRALAARASIPSGELRNRAALSSAP